MNHYIQLVPKYIKRYRNRSFLAVAGLVLAIALVTSAGVLGTSISASYLSYVKQANGSHHAMLTGLDAGQLSVLSNHIQAARVGKIQDLGRARYNDKGITIAAASYDDEALAMSKIRLDKGELPQKGFEIALEMWVLEELGLKPVLGQPVDLELYLSSAGSGLAKQLKQTFILTGILRNDNLSQMTGYSPAIVTPDALSKLHPDASRFSALLEVRGGPDIRAKIAGIRENLGVPEENVYMNESLLLVLEGSMEEKSAYVFLGILVLVATVTAIHNVFYISVLERKRHYGLLRTLGTRPGQIKAVVFGEALLLCAISIPLGIAAGIAAARGIALTASFFEGMITEIVVPPWVLLYAALVSLAAIFLSVYRPARLASNVSPLDALRGSSASGNELVGAGRGMPLLSSMFGVSGVIAGRNLLRQRKNFNATVLSMSICVVLIVVFSSFIKGADPVKMLEKEFPGEYVLSTRSINRKHGGYTADDLALIGKQKEVEHVYTTRSGGTNLLLPIDKISQEFKNYMETEFHQKVTEESGSRLFSGSAGLYSYSDNIIDLARRYLVDGQINPSELRENSQVLIVNSFRTRDGRMPVTDLKAGDVITLRKAIFENDRIVYGDEKQFMIAGVLSDYPFPMDMYTIGVGIIASEEVFTEMTGSSLYNRLDIKLKAGADSESLRTLFRSLSERISGGRLISYEQQIKELEEQKKQLTILFAGLIGIIVLATLFSIVNTISTSLLLRTREFGILRAVGLTRNQLAGIIRVEGLCYGMFSSLWGVVLGNILAYLLFMATKNTATFLEWAWPWQATLLACGASFLVGLLATVAPTKRISTLDVTEAVRAIS